MNLKRALYCGVRHTIVGTTWDLQVVLTPTSFHTSNCMLQSKQMIARAAYTLLQQPENVEKKKDKDGHFTLVAML